MTASPLTAQPAFGFEAIDKIKNPDKDLKEDSVSLNQSNAQIPIELTPH